ncbi:flagellar hook-basal body complex protein [Paragemmobacter ruber]|uniref:Flagellar basal-body rod protein FlgF n=1 Tax=Paragemmobacter ruber TaxID=1985673 RepID=A0ABW9Y4R5_9RHOB|nr:flagellar hook-basal body complex protein [Rhodobacter ruber]NBE07383.1 flagellar hook-basal body complex protein [Rhodobacter ruber]
MEATGYVTLTRQSGLMREMQVVANNIANSATNGFRREGVIFSEYVRRAGEAPSLSMALGGTRQIDLAEGGLVQTGGQFDFAIRGEGFFLLQTPDGDRLTRAGAFTPGADGSLATANGDRLLDAGGAPVVLPPGARQVMLGRDGTLTADGAPVARIGLWLPEDPLTLRHDAGTLFSAGQTAPAEGADLVQGALEESNVDPVTEVARMIEVQRAYEMGQSFLDREDERMRGMIRTIGE